MAAAIAILDASYNCLISRAYKATILETEEIFKDFATLVKINGGKPVFQSAEINYIFIRNDEITICVVSMSDHANAMMMLSFLYRFNDVLMNYFKVKDLSKDLIVDNSNLIYELFDEMMDFGIPQLTETSILRDVIKLEANLASDDKKKKPTKADDDEDDEDRSEEINSSILRSTTQVISWRPRGIFYKKNEFFLNVLEKVELIFDFKRNKLIKFKINGSFGIRCYLSGMPNLKIGLNKLSHSMKDDAFIKSLKFHQCVDLIKFNDEKIIEFIPPDGSFELLKYSVDYTKKKINPIVQIVESTYTIFPSTAQKPYRSLRFKISLNMNFPKNSSMSKLQVKIPISSTYLSEIDFKIIPKFKTNLGKVFYKFNENCIIWSINTGISGDREISMQSQFRLFDEENSIKEPTDENIKNLSMDPPPKVTKPNFEKIKEFVEDDETSNNEANANSEHIDHHNDGRNVRIEFELPDCIISGLKVEYLKIMENGLNYTSFPWIKYVCINDDDYVFRV